MLHRWRGVAVNVQQLVRAGDVAGAVEAAERASVQVVVDGLDYDVLDANAAAFDEFLDRWYAGAATVGRSLDIEGHARSLRATALCHLDGVADRAVEMYLDVQREVARLVQDAPAEFEGIADSPDATVTQEQRDEIARRSAALRSAT